MKNSILHLKKILVIALCCAFLCLLGALLSGCNSEDTTQPQPPPAEEKTYQVSIKVNNKDYGQIINENLKIEYEYGETINFRILLNPGYVLERYSDDPTNRSLERSIIVTEDIEIIAYLSEGCEFTFYGYPIVSLLNSKNLSNASNPNGLGYSYYITQNQNVNTGYLRLDVKDKENFSYFLLEQGSKKILLANYPDEKFIYGEEQFDTLFNSNKSEIITIRECDTFIGYAYAQYKDDTDEGKNPYDDIELGLFDESEIGCTLNYLYVIDGIKHVKGFTEEDTNNFITTHIAEENDSVAISSLRLFMYDDSIYFYHKSNEHKFVNYSNSWTTSWSVNNVEYTIKFNSLNA